jgi:Trk K+ transport system NAD-binding subunit
MPALAPTGNHFIVCGDGPLAYRIAFELTSRYGEEVVVVLPERLKNHGPQLSALPGVTVLEHEQLTSETFVEAGVVSARALALIGPDDIANFHAALRAQELNPDLRLVVAAFNRRLGEHIRGFFRDCTVLSSSTVAAPSFVAAALGEPAPSHVRVSGRTLYVARFQDVPHGHAVCGLGVPDDPAGTTRLIAPEELPGAPESLVLAVADGTPRDPLARKRHPVRTAVEVTRRLAWNKFGMIFMALLLAAITGFCLLLIPYHAGTAVYLAIMDTTGSALVQPTGPNPTTAPERVAQVMLTIDGMALIPLVTAIIVGARLTGSIRGEPRPRGGHVIVVGLGNVGTRVIGELHDLGFDVACVDHDPDARGVPLARRLGLPLVIGEDLAETLRAASLETSIALISVTNSDIVNLETALQARALREDVRIVLRLFDDDLAQRVQKTVGNVVSRSVSYMAAPAFAAALLEHQVLRTIAVGRHVLLIADIRVEPGADMAGQAVAELERDGQARVLALQIRGTLRFDWSPHHGYLLGAGDRVIVLATRAGLSRFLAGNRPVMSPLCLHDSCVMFRKKRPCFVTHWVSRAGYLRVTLIAEPSTWLY